MPSKMWSSVMLACLLCCVVPACTQPSQASVDAIYAAIKGNVTQLPLNGLTSSVLSIRDGHVPLALDAKSLPFIAAGLYGQGAVVIAGHETLLNFNLSSFPLNAALWLAQTTLAPSDVRVGMVTSTTSPRPLLVNLLPTQALGSAYNFTLITGRTLPSALQGGPGPAASNIQLAIFDSYTTISESEATWLAQYIQLGGAMIVAGHNWNWQSSNPLKVAATDHPLNLLLNKIGMTMLPTYASSLGSTAFPLPATLPDTAVYRNGLAAALALNSSETVNNVTIRAAAVDTLKFTLLQVPTQFLGSPLETAVNAIAAANPLLATPDSPFLNSLVTPQPALQVVTAYNELNAQKWQPASQIPTSPSASGFPSLKMTIPAAPDTIDITVNGDYTGINGRYNLGTAWISTGVYVPPSSILTITIPSAAVGKLSVRIGCHTDTLWSKASWARFPEISKTTTLNATSTATASSFGGLLYIQVPKGSTLGIVTVTISGNFARAPTYYHGTTTQADWDMIKTAANVVVPWAEFVSSKLVWTVNSNAVSTVADASALMAWWDSVLDAHATLSQVSLTRPRAERVVVDVDISAGWMHSGYPIMGYQSISKDAVNLTLLKADGAWGTFHELGHNHQLSDMEIPNHTGECTTNIWSVHAMTTIVGKTAAQGYGHSAMMPTSRTSRLQTYINNGKNWDADWSVWLCLETYIQLYEGFGWDFYYRLMNEYQNIPSAERPTTTDAKIQQWITRSAKQAGVNLGPFYKAWNFPVSNATLDGIAYLPTWTADPMIGK